jgi:hypothetical protein
VTERLRGVCTSNTGHCFGLERPTLACSQLTAKLALELLFLQASERGVAKSALRQFEIGDSIQDLQALSSGCVLPLASSKRESNAREQYHSKRLMRVR